MLSFSPEELIAVPRRLAVIQAISRSHLEVGIPRYVALLDSDLTTWGAGELESLFSNLD